MFLLHLTNNIFINYMRSFVIKCHMSWPGTTYYWHRMLAPHVGTTCWHYGGHHGFPPVIRCFTMEGRITARVFWVLLALALAASGCWRGEASGGGAAPDGDVDTDTDSDVDVDTDGDSDVDADSATGFACDGALDIVFVLDVSTSIQDFGPLAVGAAAEIAAAAEALELAPRYGLVVFVDDYLVANEGGAYDDADHLQSDIINLYAHCSTNHQVTAETMNLDYPENTLDALYHAAIDFDWREDAEVLRLIVHATDDTFWEYPDVAEPDIQVEHTYPEAIEALQSNNLRVISFAAHEGGAYLSDAEPGFFTEWDGQAAIPVATGGVVVDIDTVADALDVAVVVADFVAAELCD